MRSSRLPLICLIAVSTLAACADDNASSATASSPATTASSKATTTTTPPRPRPAGAAATFAPLTGGNGVFLLAAAPGPDLAAAGYREDEYAAAGTATAYAMAGDPPADGHMALTPTTEAPYATRVLVRRPVDDAAFNGTVVVEWLNVSSGADIAPDYTYLADELIRKGYAWAGVSAQRIGIEGGAVAVAATVGNFDTGAGKGIKTIDPQRYGSLSHPGDAYSYDIYTQIGRGLRTGGDGGPMSNLKVKRLLADGESQSAFALTTYTDGVQPLTKAFDGFLIHSRGGASAPLGEPGTGIDIAGTILRPTTKQRTDLDVPTMVVQTETDVLGVLNYYPARQPDTDRLRVWEIAGTAHADRFQLGAVATSVGCSGPVNDGQQVFVLRAALRGLDQWAAGGEAPPKAPPLNVDDSSGTPAFVLDDAGNVTGGVRTPVVDAPTARLSGLPSTDSSVVCMLMGSTTAFTPDQIAQRYPDNTYAERYATATDAAIKAGFILSDDRAAVIADARPNGTPAG